MKERNPESVPAIDPPQLRGAVGACGGRIADADTSATRDFRVTHVGVAGAYRDLGFRPRQNDRNKRTGELRSFGPTRHP